jgi:Kef-type K+ transport system membrane component KefB
MHSNIFVEVSILIALCAGIAMIMRLFRQPLIIGYIITGLLVGPSLLGLVKSPETIDVLGNFGVALLLFIVGLGLNPKVIKEVGKVSLFTGLGQVIFTGLFGYWIGTLLGYDTTTAVLIAIGLSFSSTIIILKLLTDKKEQNKLFGKISIGFLLVQDIIATIALLLVSASSNGSLSANDLTPLAVKGIAILITVILVSHYIVKPLSDFLAQSQEMLFLFAIAWGFGIAAIFYELGFSVEVGALFAGAALANLPYAQEIGSRLRPLRDFFIIVFFIALGTRLNVNDVQQVLFHSIILSTFVLIGNPIIVMIIMGLLGYTKKTSFKTSLAVAQISEFSLILVMLANTNKLVSDQVVSLLMVVAVITIAISSYMIIYSDQLYKVLEDYLKLFERKKVKHEHEHRAHVDAVLFGYKKGGSEYTHVFNQLSKKFLVVDYDPDSIDELEKQNVPYIYGDAADLQLLEEIDFTKVKLLVSVLSDFPTNLLLLKHLHGHNPSAVFICHADTIQQAIELYGLNASFVVLPHYIGNEKVGAFIKRNGFKKSEFNKYREKHLHYLQSHFENEEN